MPRVAAQLAAGEIGVGHAVEAARSLGETERVQAERARDDHRTAAVQSPGAGEGEPDSQMGGGAAEGVGGADGLSEAGAGEAGDPAGSGGDPAGGRDGDTAGEPGAGEDMAAVLDRVAAGKGPGGDRRRLREALDAEADRRAGVLAARTQRARARRRVWVGRSADGIGIIEGELTPMATAKARTVLHALARQRSADDTRSFTQRCHDALEQLFDQAMAAGRLPDQAGEQPRVLLLVRPEALHDAPDAPAAVLDGYGEVCNATARQICCDAEVTVVVQGDGGDVLDVGRDRTVPSVAPRSRATAAASAAGRRCPNARSTMCCGRGTNAVAPTSACSSPCAGTAVRHEALLFREVM